MIMYTVLLSNVENASDTTVRRTNEQTKHLQTQEKDIPLES